MNARRIVATVGLVVIAVLTVLATLASCSPLRADDSGKRDNACATDEDCPYYMTCGEGLCRERCTNMGSCLKSGETCRNGACYPDPCYWSSNCYNHSSGGPTTSTSTSCPPDGTPIRGDLALAPVGSSNSFMSAAFDATHVYFSAQVQDPLGPAKVGIKAARWADQSPIVDVVAPEANRGTPSLYRSGTSLFWTDMGTLYRVPTPPTGTPATPDAFSGTTLELATKSHVFVSEYAYPVRTLRRIDATTGAADPTPLDTDLGTVLGATDTAVFWTHANGFDGGAATYEIYRAGIASGVGQPTGVMIDLVQKGYVRVTTGVTDDAVFYRVQSGAIAKLPLVPGASPEVFLEPGKAPSAVAFVGGYLYALVSTGYCTRLHRFSLSTKAESDLLALGSVYGGTTGIWLTDDSVFFLASSYGSATQLRRAPLPK